MEATKPSVPFLLIDSADDVCYAGDICICGSRGRARTDRLVFCSQCGEAYHEYCAAGITVDEVFFDKALCADAVADAAREDAAAPAPVGPPSGAAAAAAAAAAGPTGGPLHAPAGRRLSIAKPSSWRCFNCLFCELCQEAEPECDLLVCDKCERGFHIQCVSPSLESVPKGRYLCEDCAQCTMCGSRAPGTTAKAVWKRNYELCSTCYGRERRKRQADNKAKLAECGEDEPSPKKCKRAKKVTSASGIFPAPRDSPDAEDAAAAAEEDLPEAAWGAEHREVGIRRSESDGKRRAQGRPKKKSARRTIRTSPAGTAALPKSPSPESPATASSRAPPDAASGRELSVESGTAGVSTASTSTAGSESAKVELAGRQLEMDSEADVRYRQHETAPASAPQEFGANFVGEDSSSEISRRSSPSSPGPVPPRMQRGTEEGESGHVGDRLAASPTVLWPLQPGQVVIMGPPGPVMACRSVSAPYLLPAITTFSTFRYTTPTGVPYVFRNRVPMAYTWPIGQVWAYVPYAPANFGLALGADGWIDACAKHLRAPPQEVYSRYEQAQPEDSSLPPAVRNDLLQPAHEPSLRTPSIQEAKPPEAARKLSRLPTFLKPKNLREPAASDQFADATKSHVAPSPAASRNKRRKIAPEREPAGQLPSKGAADGGPPGPPNRGLLLDAVPTYYSDTVSYSPVQSLAARRKRKLRKPAASAAPAAANRPKRIVMADVVPQDSRECALCGLVGDSEANGRMLFLECGRWVHAHCAYWSEMVAYDPPSASLESVPEAVARSKKQKCAHCGCPGASLTCLSEDCEKWVHHHCALEAGCSFFADKRMFCAAHGAGAKPVDWSRFLVPGAAAKPKGRKGKTPANADAVPPQPSAEAIGYFTKNLPVRLAVQSSATFAFLRSSTETRNNSVLRFGSVLLYNLGRIPADDPYCTDRHIYPVGYRIRRMYWSSLVPDRRCFYTCEIVEKPCRDMSCGDEKDVPVELEFVITPEEDVPVPPFVDSSATGAWAALAKKIRETRGNTVYPANGINGEHMFGLTHPCIGEAIERLPNAERCAEYRFRYLCPTAADERQTLEFSPTVLWDPVLLRSGWATNLPENVAGCARCQPYGRWREKRSAAAAAAHRGSSSRSHASGTGGGGGASSCAPTPAAFAGQESGGGGFSGAGNSEMARTNYARYRQLRKSARLHRVVPSRISGFGLLASRAYSKDRMIIEYVGEVIGQKLADRRESIYEKQNRGCYMFAIDMERIVDATMMGNAARFINHSCDPNCTAKVMTIDNEKKIIISAKKDIEAGEELTYDYQFDLETADKKIPCRCGAGNCRKWMN